jgi:hypothetical protein
VRNAFGAGAAVLLISFVVMGCGTSAIAPSAIPLPSADPSTSGQLSPTASQAPAPTPSASAPVSPTSGSVVVDATAARSVALPGPFTDPRPLAVVGSRAYYLELVSGNAASGDSPLVFRVDVADVATGSTAHIVTLAPGHMITSEGSGGTSSFDGFVATKGSLYWVEIWYDGPPHFADMGNPFGDLPQHWQVVAFDLVRGMRSIIASGTNHRVAVGQAGSTINPPVIAVDGDRVAYTLEAPAPGAPNGNKIVLQSLTDGSIIGTVTTKGFVPWIGLAGTIMAYREALGTNLQFGGVRDARLMFRTFTADAGAISVVDDHVADAAISDDRLVWGRIDETDGSAWTTSLSDGVPLHVAGPTGVGFSSGSEPGIFQVSASAGFAAWAAVGTVNGSDQSFVPFVWQVGDPSARLLALPSSTDFVAISDGWLSWHESDGPPSLRATPLGNVSSFAR